MRTIYFYRQAHILTMHYKHISVNARRGMRVIYLCYFADYSKLFQNFTKNHLIILINISNQFNIHIMAPKKRQNCNCELFSTYYVVYYTHIAQKLLHKIQKQKLLAFDAWTKENKLVLTNNVQLPENFVTLLLYLIQTSEMLTVFCCCCFI